VGLRDQPSRPQETLLEIMIRGRRAPAVESSGILGLLLYADTDLLAHHRIG
jgi:hypothetical protein